MREVRFRGKNKITRQWVYGDLIHKGGKYYIGYWFEDADSPSSNGYVECEIDPKTLGQYINIKDILDKKVFEGDIVRVERMIYINCSRTKIDRIDKFIGEIVHFQYSWCIAEKTENGIKYHFLWTWNVKDDELNSDTDFMEIISNIHDEVC